MRKHLLSLAATFALLGAPAAHAVLLAPGSTLSLPGTTAAIEPQLAGPIIEDVLTPFSFTTPTGLATGEIQSRVVRSVDGTLDFYWRVISDASSLGDIGSLRIGQFVAPEYNANFRIDGTGDLGPGAAHRFTGAEATSVNFLFDTRDVTGAPHGLAPGQSSNFMFLDTSATSYVKTAQMDLTGYNSNGFISAQYATFTPGVPEPGTYALMLAGLAGVAFMRRRKA